jgi:hypothetical protein
MLRTAARVDANQPAIVNQLRLLLLHKNQLIHVTMPKRSL